MDPELERARRAYEGRGGVEAAARVLTDLLRGGGPAAACAWIHGQVARLDEGGRTWLLHDEVVRLTRTRLEAGPHTRAEARLVAALGDLSRAVKGEWPAGGDPHTIAAALEAWRRVLPLVRTERLGLGGLFLAGTAGAADGDDVEDAHADLRLRVGRALRDVSRDLGLDRP